MGLLMKSGEYMDSRYIKSNVYCPYCLVALTQVKKTGHQFCNASLINCDYEVTPHGRPPLTLEQCQGALKLRYKQQLEHAYTKIRRLNKEVVLLNEKLQSIEQHSIC